MERSSEQGIPADDFPTTEQNTERSGRTLDEENKRLMSLGRERSRWVDAYIKALEIHKYHGRGVPTPDPEKLTKQIAKLNEQIANASGVERVLRIQERTNCEKQLAALDKAKEFEELEARFLSVIKQFSIDRKISFQTWREAGVTVRTLAKAGMYPPKAKHSTDAESNSDDLDSD